MNGRYHLPTSVLLSIRGFVAMTAVSAALMGCAPQPLVNVSDPEAAVTLLDQSFRAWQAGRSVDELRQADPPVYVAEDLWKQKARLTDFSIDDRGELFGTNVRIRVTVKGFEKSGKRFSDQLHYLVTTTPALTIVREDR